MGRCAKGFKLSSADQYLPSRRVELRGAYVEELIKGHQPDLQLITPCSARALVDELSRDRRLPHRRQPAEQQQTPLGTLLTACETHQHDTLSCS